MTEHENSCDVIMLATPEIDDYAKHSSALWAAYCKRKGFHFFRYSDRLVPDMHINWSKIEMVRRHLARSTAEIVTLVDADTYVCNPHFSIPEMLQQSPSKSIVFSSDTTRNGLIELPLNLSAAIEHRALRLPNAGFIVIRNSQFALEFFESWMALARNELNHLSDIHPRNQRVLWKGLYFQNRDQVGLLRGEVRRLQTEDQLDNAIREGCDVAHVRYALSPQCVGELIRQVEALPSAVKLEQTPRPQKSGRPRRIALRADGREQIAYWPALLRLNCQRFVERAVSQRQQRAADVVVSLTSFPDRFSKLHICIQALLAQNVRPDAIILYLAREECSEDDIPPRLKALCGEHFQIRFVETNVRSLNKIYHALREFPDKTIVTSDDDKIYPSHWLEGLVAVAKSHQGCIVCNRSRTIELKSRRQVASYREWRATYDTEPSLAVLPMGVGGVLYPVGSLHQDVLNADLFRELCETSDDLWLKVMSLRMGTYCAQVGKSPEKYTSIPFWNGRKLSPRNIWEGGNDQNLQKLITHFELDIPALLEADETKP